MPGSQTDRAGSGEAARPERLAFEAGIADTRAALAEWAEDRFRVLLGWGAGAALIAAVLLGSTLVVAHGAESDAGAFLPLAVDPGAGFRDVLYLLLRNGSVLLLHLLVCLASYLARRSVPLRALSATGVNAWVHRHAGPAALAMVAGCTVYSLSLQAWVLGHDLAIAADTLGLSQAGLLARLCLHGLPELTAVFLPLAACLMLGRRREWNALAAASLLSAAVALPVLVASAVAEVYLTRVLF